METFSLIFNRNYDTLYLNEETSEYNHQSLVPFELNNVHDYFGLND